MSDIGFGPYRQFPSPQDPPEGAAMRAQRWRALVKGVQGGTQINRTVLSSAVPQVLLNSCSPVAVDAVLRQHRDDIDEISGALERARQDVIGHLAKAGLAPDLADRLMRYVDLKVFTDLALTEIVADEARALYARRDPAEALSAAELEALLGVSDERVRNREQAGELFSILRPGRKRGREYPAFQAWEGIAGEPLKQLLAALGYPGGPAAHGFFTSAQDTLGGLSPIEALLGFCRPQVASDEVREFLCQSPPERLAIVVRAAQTYAAFLAA